ncbi:MAG: hypothetical protein QOE45_2456 [Frankiaceae bacterium]|jgi:hypothetical protein|nr:hypothetical protein [Frankiaceae bacterium]
MRTASRVFAAIGAFGLTVCLVFASASRFRYDNLQGVLILAFFFVACLFLAVFLRRQGAIELDGLVLPGADAHADEEIHLPGPSWYPAFYGVTLLVLALGLVFDKRVALAGVALTVLTTIGWAVESVKDYRREVAHARPEVLPLVAAIGLAHQIVAFARQHGGADAVVQHVGRGSAEVVLVGADGAWGSLVGESVPVAREAAALAGVTSHTAWPAGLGNRIRTTEEEWVEMGGAGALTAPDTHVAPRDGSTQTAARVFLGLAIFAFLIDAVYSVASRFRYDNLQGMAILTAFGLACLYLYLGLKHAKAQPDDVAFAGDDHVTIEPTVPDPPVDLATLHLPGPSWWPAFFSVALGALAFGLVFSKPLLFAGLFLTVACCVGWGVESVREYRQSLAGHHGDAAHASH